MIRNYTKVSIINAFLSIYLITSLNHLQKLLLRKACNIFFGILACILFTSSIASAIDINSCTVINTPGTYTLTASISNSSATKCIEITSSNVTLEGNGYTIDGVETSETFGIYAYNSSGTLDDVIIRNITITNWKTGIYLRNVLGGTIEESTIRWNKYAGLQLTGCNTVTIQNNTISTNTTHGIHLTSGSNNIHIIDNGIYDQGNGIQLEDSHQGSIYDNDIAYNQDGIDADSADGWTIMDNKISYNHYGIILYFSHNSTISGNRITDNGYEDQYAGVWYMWSGNNLFYNNYFDNYQNVRYDTGPPWPGVGANLWNIDKELGRNIVGGPYLGGNYYGPESFSNYCADSDGDYLCDEPYTFWVNDLFPLKYFPDEDGDGVADPDDNCVNISNPSQTNSDGDEHGNACDNCWYVDNSSQADTNDNCSDPPYLADPECGDACELSDTDGDGIPDEDDNCPTVSNSNQMDGDDDGVGDACDNCVNISNPDQSNWDGDPFGNSCDNCWSVSSSDQADRDGDCIGPPYSMDPGCGDACDQCPDDSNKLHPGQCGCGVPDIHSDGDGIADCVDNCPEDRTKIEPGICGCGVPDTDVDNDGYLYCHDNCPNTANDQTDTDGDGLGDRCDNCPNVPNRDNQEDSDDDGVGDVCDNCSDTPNGPKLGTCTDGCPSCIGNTCAHYNHCNAWGSTNGYCSQNQEDSDGDGIGDACDPDDDNDGVPDASDNCRTTANPNQDDTDGDGLGDDCNDAFDTDGDEWEDSIDNCPEFNNPTQTDDDNNGIGDNCEFDLTIQRVEITQGIQDHNNSVPLISGKHIWVRVYLDVGTAGVELGPVRGWFRFKDEHGLPNPPFINGAYQPDQLLYSENSIMAPPNPDPTVVSHTINFIIPASWSWPNTPYMELGFFYNGPFEEPMGNNGYPLVPLMFHHAPDLDIVFVPVYSTANVYVPGFSKCPPPNSQDFWAAARWVEALYPISEIRMWKSGDHFISWDPTESGWNGARLYNDLWWINLFTNDPVDDMRYYGMVCKEMDPLGHYDGSSSGCNYIQGFLSGNGQSGMGWGDQSWGVRQDDRTTSTLGGQMMAHEIGHTILGNDEPWYQLDFWEIWPAHVRDNCGAHGPYLDYPDTSDRGNLGLLAADTYGFDGNTVYHPDRFFDIMTYSPCWNGTPNVGFCSITTSTPCETDCDCPNGTCSSTTSQRCRTNADCPLGESCENAEICDAGRWISATNYKRIFNKLSEESGLRHIKAMAVTAEQEYLVAAGIISLTEDVVESLRFHRLFLPVGTDDESKDGIYSLELQRADGSILFIRYFNLGGENPEAGSGFFGEKVPYYPETSRIQIKHGDVVLETISVSSNSPEVTVIYPNGGEDLTGEVIIQWTANDIDGDTLTYDILYSRDNGNTWSAVAVGLEQNNYVWNTNQASGSSQGLIRVLASDSVNTGRDDSDLPFTVTEKSPEAIIISPADNTSFFPNKVIIFQGNGYDLEDGPLSGDSLSWSSDEVGILASGKVISLNDLSPGDHTITFTAEDSDGNVGSASINITIFSVQDSDGDKIGDDNDNCPFIYNPDQADSDRDGVGDQCDEDDSDNDGYPDNVDNCPLIPNSQSDIDGDGCGDVCDNPRYDILPDVVTDLNSGLVWQRTPKWENVDSWEAAVTYCQAINQGDEEGWRLPTVDEFNSLTDLSMSNPVLPQNHPFRNIRVVEGWYWTSTDDPGNSGNAFYIDMSDGKAYSWDKDGWKGLAWCVSCQTWYEDADGDGFSSGNSTIQRDRPVDFFLASELTAISGDCNDNDEAINHGASEICMDGIDNNCNGQMDYFDWDCGGNVDDDEDGLSNGEEIWFYKTSFEHSDTDGDGLDDGTEVGYWEEDWDADPDGDGLVNLLDPDSDNDALVDGIEVDLLHTNPGSADTDGDGINDGDEDNDGDGFSNAKEVESGSDPTDPNSRPIRAMPGIPLLLLSD